jgi:uncharacterized protein (TIGR00297 family)
VAAAAALLAWRADTLTRSGTAAAWLVGTAVLMGTGWRGGAVLAAFFVGSTLAGRGAPRPDGIDAKGERRDHRQVLANGGAAALAALVGLHDARLGHWLVTCAFAAAAADTFATGFGTRSRTPPRLLLSGTRVPSGTSGGVTPLGLAGGALGAALVAATGAATARWPILFPVAFLIGFAGTLLDSALGATVQGRFRCESCGQPSEWPVHRCGRDTVHQGGWRWLDNDGVNLSAALVATAGGWALWAWLSR